MNARVKSAERRAFVGGSDARIIMGDEPHTPMARKAGRNRTPGPVRQPYRAARDCDRAAQPAVVRKEYRERHHERSAEGTASSHQVDGRNPRRRR